MSSHSCQTPGSSEQLQCFC